MPKMCELLRLCPNVSTNEASRQFNVNPMGPQTVICLLAVSVRKYIYIHEWTLITLNADEMYDLSCTLRKPFLSTSRLRNGSD